MHVAIQIEQTEIEGVLDKRWQELHGFALKSFSWEMDEADGTLSVICVAERLDDYAKPQEPFVINEELVRTLVESILSTTEDRPVPVPETGPGSALPVAAIAAALSAPHTVEEPAGEPAGEPTGPISPMGHPVSWIDNPGATPMHPQDNLEKVKKRSEKMLAIRRNAEGNNPPFDPRNPPPDAQTDKH